jgi:hypothetical protein
VELGDVNVVCNGRAGLTVTAFASFNNVPGGSKEKHTSVRSNSRIGVVMLVFSNHYIPEEVLMIYIILSCNIILCKVNGILAKGTITSSDIKGNMTRIPGVMEIVAKGTVTSNPNTRTSRIRI